MTPRRFLRIIPSTSISGLIQVNSGTVITNIAQSAEFKAMTVNVVAALVPFSEAKRAVLLALGGPEIED